MDLLAWYVDKSTMWIWCISEKITQSTTGVFGLGKNLLRADLAPFSQTVGSFLRALGRQTQPKELYDPSSNFTNFYIFENIYFC